MGKSKFLEQMALPDLTGMCLTHFIVGKHVCPGFGAGINQAFHPPLGQNDGIGAANQSEVLLIERASSQNDLAVGCKTGVKG